ncbi:MAG: metallophosphoesterase [Prevotella sp.]|nr:metallophosphoesterase [Prevotella sp.]
MRTMWMLLFMGLPLLALSYIGWHIWCLLPLSAIWKTVVIIIMTGCFLLTFGNFSRAIDQLSMPWAIVNYHIGTSSLIILLYLFMLFLVLDLGRLMRLIPRTLLYNNWATAGGIVVLMAAIFTYGYLHYKHKYREDIKLTTEKPMTKSLKLVMMSDLHLGYHNRREELHRWVDIINEEHADAILIAGDIIDMSVRPLKEEQMYEEFLRLNAPVYACLGNHEYYSGEPDAQKFYEQAGIHLLQDSCATVGDLCIVGRDDRTNLHRKTLADIMKQADHSKFTILLDHQPYHLEQAERQRIDFQFSGHTHHGQVWPISWITEAIYECAFGTHQRGDTQYYVSSGIGIWGGKFRIGTRSEYVVVTISQK